MKLITNRKESKRVLAPCLVLVAAMIGLTGISVFGQTDVVAVNQDQQTKPAPVQPMVTELRGITIGMTADEVNAKLGKAKLTEEFSLYYDFPGGESMQVVLDADKKVKMAAMIYMGNKVDAPEYAEVFGPAVAIKKEADGRIYNLVRYPDAGFWVAYSRLMVEDDPMTTVTIQAMD